MNPRNKKIFLLFFVVITLCDVLASSTGHEQLRWFFKPAVMITLIIFYAIHTLVATRFDRLIIAAFTFSFYGDVLLIRSDKELFFMIGVLMFMLCHVFYIKAFIPLSYSFSSFFKDAIKKWWILLILTTVGVAVYWSIYTSLGLVLQIAVGLYILIIVTMSAMAFLRRTYTSIMSYNCGIVGAILFMISDAILALDMFAYSIPYEGAIIMLTYAVAQYFLAYAFISESKMRIQSQSDSEIFVDNLALDEIKR